MRNNYNNLPVVITSVTSNEPISDVPCGTCTRCCELLAPMLSSEEITSGLYPLSLINPTEQQRKENPNSNIVVTLYRKPGGGCGMFIDGRCSIYDIRPKACRQFDCRKGHYSELNEFAKEKFNL